jgi:hypothetical protein
MNTEEPDLKEIDLGVLWSAYTRVTCERSGHETRTGEFHMSSLHQKKEEILAQMRRGQYPNVETLRKFYQGTHAEEGILKRLKVAALMTGLHFGEPREICAFDGRLRGHIDCEIEGTLIEVKTVPDRAALSEIEKTKRLPWRVYSQIQAYMRFGNFERAICLYETRSEGYPLLLPVAPDRSLQDELTRKAEWVLEQMGRD